MDDIKVIVPLKNSWEMAVPHQEVPQGLTSLKARDCGLCHVQHYEEWQKSTHANAWTDKQFQAELKKESSPFMCINCHIPLQNQQEYIIKGLENGDIYQTYCMAARNAAEVTGARFIPVDIAFAEAWQAAPGHRGLLMTTDGIHPTGEGHRLIMNTLLTSWGLV